jgi:DNA-binding CsgD family transcriptional regulator
MAVIDRLLSSARQGTSGTLVLSGEPGIGKSALLRWATEQAEGDAMAVAVAGGTQTELSLDFAGLHQLLLPFGALRADLPPPQQQALAAAFGEVVGPPPDRFLVALAALTLLTDAAADRPLLCAVDDAQWIDQESIAVLAFVGRRLHAAGIALLFATRPPRHGPDALDGFPRTEVAGLDEDAAAALLARTATVPPIPSVARAIASETQGNPLALEELGRRLTEEQALGASGLPPGLPIGRRLEATFLDQVRSLPGATQTLLLLAAAEGSGDADLVGRAAASLGVPPEALDPAVSAALVSLGPTIEFRHPLVRSAVYAGATPGDRRRAHGALGAATDARLRPDQRALHRAAACIGPDAAVADELEASAARARDRGGYAAEASLLIRAAELSPDSEIRATRFLAAGRSALLQGAPMRVQALLDQAEPDLSTPLLRATAKRLHGLIQEPQARPHLSAGLLLAAARDLMPLDRDVARDTLLEAVNALHVSFGWSEGATIEEVAGAALVALAEQGTSTTPEDVLLEAMAGLYRDGHAASVPALRRAADQLHQAPTRWSELPRWQNVAAIVSNELYDDEAYRLTTEVLERTARDRGALLALQYALLSAATFDTRSGRLTRARERYAEMLEVTAALGSYVEFYALLDLELLAWLGDDDGTRAKAQVLIEQGTAVRSRAVVYRAQLAIVVLDLGRRRYPEALSPARMVADDGMPGWTSLALPFVVEAAVRCGEEDVARAAVDELASRVATCGTALGRGLLARSRALLAGPSAAAGPLYEEAIELLATTHMATELAWAHLVHGEWLRRDGRRAEARSALRTAHAAFADMGAAAFAERARIELEATGERARRRSVDTALDLTPQEAQVARLAAERLTSREIAAQLFISAKTVEYHLGKVFRKLGISSRRELAAALAGD